MAVKNKDFHFWVRIAGKRLKGNKEQAEDIIQDIETNLFRNTASIENMSAYVNKGILNHTINISLKSKLYKKHCKEVIDNFANDVYQESPFDTLAQKQAHQIKQAFCKTLPESQQHAFLKIGIEEYTLSEYAAEFNVNYTTAKRNYSIAVQKWKDKCQILI